MNFTVYQVKLGLLIFLGIYVVFGFIIIAISQITKSSIASAFTSNNMNIDDATLISSIDVSLHAQWLLYSAFLPWGVIIIVLGFYGALSVILERRALIKVFGFLLLIVASMKVPVTAYSMFESGTTENISRYTKSDMLSNFEKSDSNTQAALARDFIQDWHACCGINDYTDYKIFKKAKIVYPKSCCYHDSEECYSSGEVKSDGCAEKVADTYLSSYRMMSGMTLFITLLEVFGTVASMYLPRLLLKRQIMLKGSR